MPITIGNNIAALKALRKLGEHSESAIRVSERLASGLRINRASDDAAGLSIASSLSNTSRLYAQANRNVNDGISLLNLADSALEELTGLVTRIQELAEQAANGSYSSTQRNALDREAQQLVAEYSRIVATTKFNTHTLLDGSASFRLQVGVDGTALSQIDASVPNAATRYQGTGEFGSGASFSAAQRLLDVELADLNGDGNLDAVTVSDNGAGVPVYLGNGDGTFKASYTIGGSGVTLAIGDLNGDGIIDVVSEGTTEDPYVKLGNGNGTFKAPVLYDGGSNANRIALADVNGDGYLDILNNDNITGTLGVQLNNGNGTFKAVVSFSSSTTENTLQLKDFNADGAIDALVGYGSDVLLFIGNGNGTFKASTTINSGAGRVVYSADDFNNDGFNDLILSDATSHVYLRLGNGNGTFKSETNVAPTGDGYSRVIHTDFDDDGNLDLILADTTAPYKLQVALGNGNGTFHFGTTFALPSGHFPQSFAAGDANNDGVPDLFAVTYTDNTIDVLLQNSELVAGLPTIDLTTQANALEALSDMSQTLTDITTARGTIGAIMSRLEVAYRYNSAMQQNTLTASSRILDADMAEETARYVRLQILQQATTSILAQANLTPRIALQLIQDL